MTKLEATSASRLLRCDLPIILAGMGGVARSELVAAVTAAGGFGFLGMVRESPELIRQEVEALRRTGHTNFGVNIIPAATDRALLDVQIETIIELEVPAVSLFWDIDTSVVARLRNAGIIVLYQVGSVDEGIVAERAGAHLIVAQGVEAGGHVRGTRQLRDLLPELVAAVDVPVLAAGGLAMGGDLLTAQALGADGIVLGTALMATNESFAHEEHKSRLLAAAATDTVLTDTFHINWPPGAPVRVLKSEVTAGNRGPSHAEHRTAIGDEGGRPIYLFSTDSPLRSMTGDLGAMALYAGTGVGAIREIVPAGTRIRDLAADAERLLAATAVPDAPISASAVCYAGEMSGAYMGTIEPGELASALPEIAGDLQRIVRGILADGRTGPASPPFAAEAYPLAAWTVALRQLAGGSARARTHPADLPALVRRLGDLLPRTPDGDLRERLLALKQVLDERALSQVVRTLQLSLTS